MADGSTACISTPPSIAKGAPTRDAFRGLACFPLYGDAKNEGQDCTPLTSVSMASSATWCSPAI